MTPKHRKRGAGLNLLFEHQPAPATPKFLQRRTFHTSKAIRQPYDEQIQ